MYAPQNFITVEDIECAIDNLALRTAPHWYCHLHGVLLVMLVTSVLESSIQVKDLNGQIVQIPFKNLHANHELIDFISKQAIFQLAFTLGMNQYRQQTVIA